MKKVILRKAQEKDLDSMWNKVWQDKELAKYMLWKPVENYEEAKIRLEKTIEYQKSNLAFYICLEETDEVVGFLGAIDTGDGVFEDCGLCIAGKYQRNGYGRQALQLLIKMIFEELGGKEFIYSCFEENTASQKLCESLGFKYKYSRQNIRKWDGLEYTARYYSLIKKEKVTILAFKDTSAEQLVKDLDFPTVLLPSDKILDSEIAIDEIQKSSCIICFGQKPQIKNQICLELIAKNQNEILTTNFEIDSFKQALKEHKLPYSESRNPGTSYCNLVYWNSLNYIKEKNLDCKFLFIHIPFLENMNNLSELQEKLNIIIKDYFCHLQNPRD